MDKRVYFVMSGLLSCVIIKDDALTDASDTDTDTDSDTDTDTDSDTDVDTDTDTDTDTGEPPYCGDGIVNQDWEQCDGDDLPYTCLDSGYLIGTPECRHNPSMQCSVSFGPCDCRYQPGYLCSDELLYNGVCDEIRDPASGNVGPCPYGTDSYDCGIYSRYDLTIVCPEPDDPALSLDQYQEPGTCAG